MNYSWLLPFMALQWPGQAATVSLDQSFADKCASFANTLQLPDTIVWFTEHVTPGTNITFPDNHPTCGRPGQVVQAELCRVAMFVTTSPTSNLSFEAWLPSDWSGRFLSTGNGGVSGCIQYEDMAYGVGLGFASVSANNGHNGTSALPMFKKPQVVEDFAYRSVHTGAVLGKQITQAFYGKEHSKSYYLGCSTGGRQGLKEAQDFPEDFDGIVAGAPAVSFTGLLSRSASLWGITGAPGSPTFLNSTEWNMVHKEALKQCDTLDGVSDGVIEDPNLCRYRPESLLCGQNQTTDCLTPAQVETANAVFSSLYGVNGTLIYPAMVPGGDGLWGVQFGNQPFPYSTEWFKYVVYEDENWDPATIGPKDYDAALKQNPYNIQTWKGDLSAVRDRGVKILHWHGLQDGLISSEISQLYYNHVSRTMNLKSNDLDEFYRYFRVSGTGHCAGGSGASNIGNRLATVGGMEPESNVLLAIVQWVEKGVAPDTIEGSKFVDGLPGGDVEYKRRHCRYPYRNVWDGVGDSNNPDSWSCKT